MNIALRANRFHPEIELQLGRCLDYLLGRGLGVWIDEGLQGLAGGRALPSLPPEGALPPEISMIFALGGDGTVLAAARLAGSSEVPIFAVNLGNFGFLTTSNLAEFPRHFDRILAGDYEVEERMNLKAVVLGPEGEGERFFALNEFVLHKGALARPIVIDVRADDDHVGMFPCDGVIVTTPTGSTAYSLSAGGPILYPLMNAMAITPICPHTLAVRPLVVPAEIPIVLSERSRHQDVILTVDGQNNRSIGEDDRVLITRAEHVTRLVRPFEGSFFFRLRSKLKWWERERK